jgi:hypothetical protein
MKYLLSALLLLSFGLKSRAQDQTTKRYHVPSAKIEYQVISPQGKGQITLFFDHYGMRESKHETLQKKGKTVKDQLTILNNGKSYVIDLLTNSGQDVSGATGMAMSMGGKDMSATGKKMLQAMGGKQVGSQNFLGKNCEKWEVNAMGKTTMLIWQGVPLKTETSVMGMTSSQVATSLKTGLSFSTADFQPPAGVKMETPRGMMDAAGMGMSPEDKAQMKKLMNMSFEDFKKMVKKDDPNASDEQIRQSYDLIKKMGKFIK